MTPGLVDEDFPALAPSKTAAITKPAVLVATPPIAIPAKKVVAMKNPGSAAPGNSTLDSLWSTRTEEEVAALTMPASEALVVVVGTPTSKKRPELPRVDTSSPNATKDERTPTPATGLRMIKILSTQGGLKGAIPQSAVSETASVSGMSSRPVSPPPLPPQQQTSQKKSKSALKRERREKERKEAEEKERELEREKESEKERLRKTKEEVHAPVVGRMKKKDKKRADGSIESPSSPYPTEEKDESIQTSATEKCDAPTSSTTTNVAPEPVQTPTKTATTMNKTTAQLLQEMSDVNFATLEMFKPIVGLKWELHITADDLAQIKIHDRTTAAKLEKSEQQLQQSGMTEISLRGGGTVATHQLITPGGSVLVGLTQEQEARFVKLEENRKREKGWERYPATQKDWNALGGLPSKNAAPSENKEDGKVKGRVTLDELERRVMAARKETEGNEKKLEKLLKRNKKLVGLV